jgi:hypothetical protein
LKFPAKPPAAIQSLLLIDPTAANWRTVKSRTLCVAKKQQQLDKIAGKPAGMYGARFSL